MSATITERLIQGIDTTPAFAPANTPEKVSILLETGKNIQRINGKPGTADARGVYNPSSSQHLYMMFGTGVVYPKDIQGITPAEIEMLVRVRDKISATVGAEMETMNGSPKRTSETAKLYDAIFNS